MVYTPIITPYFFSTLIRLLLLAKYDPEVPKVCPPPAMGAWYEFFFFLKERLDTASIQDRYFDGTPTQSRR